MPNYDFSEEIQGRMNEFVDRIKSFKGMDEPSGWQTALKVLLAGVLLGILVNWLMKTFGKSEEEDQKYTTGFPLIQTTKAPVHGVVAVKNSPFEPVSACSFATF